MTWKVMTISTDLENVISTHNVDGEKPKLMAAWAVVQIELALLGA